ncbi:unnamed protein product [Penicillium palitans]
MFAMEFTYRIHHASVGVAGVGTKVQTRQKPSEDPARNLRRRATKKPTKDSVTWQQDSAETVNKDDRKPKSKSRATCMKKGGIASALFAQEGSNAAGIAVIALIFLYQACYCVAFSPLPVAYSVEILPYSIRAKGMGVYVFSTKAAIFVNQYVNPIGLSSIGWRFYLVYVVILVIESIIAYGWFVETGGRSLEEIKEIFDGGQGRR